MDPQGGGGRIPREAVDAPAVAVVRARLDGALNNLIEWDVSMPMAAGVGTTP